MERTTAAIEKKYLRKAHKGIGLTLNQTSLLLCSAAFFGSRCEISPLGSITAFALCSAMLPDTSGFLPAFAFVVLGLLSKGYYSQIRTDLLICGTLACLHFIVGRKRLSGLMCALTGGAVCLLGKLAFPYIFRLTPVGYMTAVLSAIGVFCLTLPFFYAIGFAVKSLRKKTFAHSLSIFLFLAFSACGLAYIILGVPLYLAASAIMILYAAFAGGAISGILMGIFTGLALTLCGICTAEIFPVTAVFGLTAGLLKQKGKLFSTAISALVFLFTAAYYYPRMLNFTSSTIFTASCIVFLFIPAKNTALFGMPQAIAAVPEDSHIHKVKSHTVNLLRSAASGFERLSYVFEEDKQSETLKSRLKDIMGKVQKRSCKLCGMSAYCWGRDMEKTKRIFSRCMKIYEDKGIVSPRDFNGLYADFCIEPDSFLSAINKEFEIHKQDAFWQMKLKENRYILREELSSFSKILDEISRDVSKNMEFLPDLEELAEKRLIQEGFSNPEVSIWENADGSKNASIKMEGCNEAFVCTQRIIPIMNRIMGCKLRQRTRLCSQMNQNTCFIELESISGLRIFAGACTWGKAENGTTGDCYSVMDMGNKKILALADGMGYGAKAGLESQKVMELLELLIDSGLDEELSVKLINSSLVPQNTKENFSTLDVCVIDRITGSGYFLKAGASSAYIVRGEKIKSVKSSSLPVGIIAEASSENIPVSLKPGDTIIMVTDGVWDIIEQKGGDAWLYGKLKEIRSKNPSALSEYLLKEARADAVPCETDDMTVLCAKVWGNAG